MAKYRVMIKEANGETMYSAKWLDTNPLAEVARLNSVITGAQKAFKDFDANEGEHYIPDEDNDWKRYYALANALGIKRDSDGRVLIYMPTASGDPCEDCKNIDGNRCIEPGVGDKYRFDIRNFPKLPCPKYEKDSVLDSVYGILVRYFSDDGMVEAGQIDPPTLGNMNLDYEQPVEWYHELVKEIIKEFRTGKYSPRSKEG